MAGHGDVIDAGTNRGLSNVSFRTSSHSAVRILKPNRGLLLNGQGVSGTFKVGLCGPEEQHRIKGEP